MMKKRLSLTSKLILCVVLMLLAGAAGAQQARIGYVNFARLLQESPQAASAMAALQEEFAPRDREVKALVAEFTEKQEQIQRDLDVMGPEERRNAENELRRDEREIKRQQQELQEDANLRQNEAMRKLQGELLREVQNFATTSGFDLIVYDGVAYASDAIDITPQVLEGLKAGYDAQTGG